MENTQTVSKNKLTTFLWRKNFTANHREVWALGETFHGWHSQRFDPRNKKLVSSTMPCAANAASHGHTSGCHRDLDSGEDFVQKTTNSTTRKYHSIAFTWKEKKRRFIRVRRKTKPDGSNLETEGFLMRFFSITAAERSIWISSWTAGKTIQHIINLVFLASCKNVELINLPPTQPEHGRNVERSEVKEGGANVVFITYDTCEHGYMVPLRLELTSSMRKDGLYIRWWLAPSRSALWEIGKFGGTSLDKLILSDLGLVKRSQDPGRNYLKEESVVIEFSTTLGFSSVLPCKQKERY